MEKNIYNANTNEERAKVAILISDQVGMWAKKKKSLLQKSRSLDY